MTDMPPFTGAWNAISHRSRSTIRQFRYRPKNFMPMRSTPWMLRGDCHCHDSLHGRYFHLNPMAFELPHSIGQEYPSRYDEAKTVRHVFRVK